VAYTCPFRNLPVNSPGKTPQSVQFLFGNKKCRSRRFGLLLYFFSVWLNIEKMFTWAQTIMFQFLIGRPKTSEDYGSGAVSV